MKELKHCDERARLGFASVVTLAAILVSASVLFPAEAYAYVGPGAGLTVIGTLVALVGSLVLSVIGIIWYPLKRLRAKRKARREQTVREA